MAIRSRTYLPTDWQLWTYTPVSGKFRLDFSALNGSDVLGGATDLGSIAVFPLDIASIQLDDGQRPEQGVFFSFAPATLAISAQLDTWSENTIKELYNGKQVFLTLKNEGTNSHPIFGKNTVYFVGQIDSLTVDVDPINKVTNLQITAIDLAGSAVNTPILVSRTVTKGAAIQLGLEQAQRDGLLSSYFLFSLTSFLGTTWETAGTYSTTFGALMDEYVSAEVARLMNYTIQSYTAGNVGFYRVIYGLTINANPLTGNLIPDSIITNISIQQDSPNTPTAYDLSNSTATYSYGTVSASLLSNPTVYSASLDVPTASLQVIANTISQFKQKIQPVEVTVRTAQTYQTINFDNSIPGINDYFYPQNHYFNGNDVKTMPAFTGGTYYHSIVGTSHTITPDDWQTTYQLWKGL